MKRTLALLAALLFAPLAARSADTKSADTKAPFRVLYSDDTTRPLGCFSSYHEDDPRRIDWTTGP